MKVRIVIEPRGETTWLAVVEVGEPHVSAVRHIMGTGRTPSDALRDLERNALVKVLAKMPA